MSRMTQKIQQLTIAAAALVATSSIAVADDVDPKLETVRDRIVQMFDMIERDDVKPSPVDGWYTIHKGSLIAYISGDGRYLLQGDMIDLDLQTNLTENLRNESRRELMANLSDDEAIVFAPENVKHKISVFTDIDCTYCRRLHSQIQQYLDLGIEVRYLMYPRSGPASPSWTKAEDVWCSPDRRNALTQAKLDRDFPTSECDASIINNHYSMGHEIGLTGTPAIVLEDGTLIGGYLAPDQLSATLETAASRK
jgi:thiol:disulfide interchange protein DsbC